MTQIFCTFQIPAFHRWENAPIGFDFLACEHRHNFHFKVTAKVTHSDREIEFIQMKTQACWIAREILPPDPDKMSFEHVNFGSKSCEMLAQELGKQLSILYHYEIVSVEVSEDGENGAVWTKE